MTHARTAPTHSLARNQTAHFKLQLDDKNEKIMRNNNHPFFFVCVLCIAIAEPISFGDTEDVQFATEGLDFLIRCDVNGDEKVTRSWKVGGKALRPCKKIDQKRVFCMFFCYIVIG